MQAIILAAGIGSRLNSGTKLPKCMLEISGKTIVRHQLEMLDEFGAEKAVVVTGYAAEEVETYLKSLQKELGLRLKIVTVVNPFYRLTNVLGSYWFGMKYLDDSFLYLEGDTIFERDMFKEVFDSKADCALSIKYDKVDEEAMKVVINGGKLTHISKAVDLDSADGEFFGLARFSDRVRKQFEEYADKRIRSEVFSDYFEYVLSESIHRNDDFTYDFISVDNRYCCEIDFPEDYDFALRNYKA